MHIYYNSCDEIPIHNFYEFLAKKDSQLLLNNDNLYNLLCNKTYSWYLRKKEYVFNRFKINYNENNQYLDIWNSIYENYLKAIGDNTTLIYYELVNDLLYLETRYSIASSLLQQILMGRMSDEMLRAYILELRKWNYKIDEKKPLTKELERMVRQLRGSENKIRIKKEEKKELEKGSTNEKMTLIEQQVKLELALSKNEIDTKKTVVSKWITMIKEVKLINDQRKKKNGK